MVTFEDPLMIVHGEKNFRVQFVSLIKFFSNITMEYSTTANDGAKPFKVIDPGSSGADSVDLVVPNRQIYRFARDGWLARKTLPEVVDLQVTTVLTVSKTSGLIEKHVDTWQGKHDNWLYARIGKPTVGRATSMWFRLLGW
jgi:hypothetical protein